MLRVNFILNRLPIFVLLVLTLLLTTKGFAQNSGKTKAQTDSSAIQTEIPAEANDTFRNPFVKMYGTKADTMVSSNSVPVKKTKNKKIDTAYYSPKTAALRALACPGLGQIYNKKYWKLPIVYGVIGTVSYFVASNSIKLKQFNGYIRNYYNEIPNPSPYDRLSLTEIESLRNGYRRNVQIASFGTVLAWGLSIVDAAVDAHMRTFDVSDKLTLELKPELNYTNFIYYAGINVNLQLK
jgi:hypothetical protein